MVEIYAVVSQWIVSRNIVIFKAVKIVVKQTMEKDRIGMTLINKNKSDQLKLVDLKRIDTKFF